MATHIVIRHVSGSKANRSQEFSLSGLSRLTIGRDPGSTLVFDGSRDGMVSRHHAVIEISGGQDARFRIADQGSQNRTIVNGRAIVSRQDIRPGDVVELGAGGPKFVFGIRPAADGFPARPDARPLPEPGETEQWPINEEGFRTAAITAAAAEAVRSNRAMGRGALARIVLRQNRGAGR